MCISRSGSVACRRSALVAVVLVALTHYATASQRPSESSVGVQEPQAPVDGHGAHQELSDSPEWRFMQDGVVFLTFNRQARPRGDTEFVSQNWWMGMGRRPVGPGTLTLIGMLSLEPATVGSDGYSEIFQTGEAFQGRPITDRQHSHDFAMQLAGVWRVPLTSRTRGSPSRADPLVKPRWAPWHSCIGLRRRRILSLPLDTTHSTRRILPKVSLPPRSITVPGPWKALCFTGMSRTKTDGTSPMSVRWIAGRRGYGFVQARSGSSKRHTATFTSQRNWKRAVYDAPRCQLRG